MTNTQGYQRFFAELKRRRVFRVMAVYGATAFVLLQVADLLAQGMGLSDQVLRITTFLVLIGFPIAIVLAWAFDSTPEGMKRTEDATPEEIAEILAQTASRRWMPGLLALAGVGLLFGGWWMGRQTAAVADSTGESGSADVRLAFADPTDDSRPSIAVLPFVNMSADEEQEYFSDGMTEEVINTLVGISDLRVAGRTSAFAYKGENRDLREIGAELGVDYLVEGSVRKADDRLRITAQLIDSSDGTHLWSEQYDKALVDVFAIQSEIAQAIAEALTIPLGLEDSSDLVTPTGDLKAYDLYLAGRTHMRQRGLGLVEAKRLFEAAIDRDSAWAPSWAALAEVLEIRVWYTEALGAASSDTEAIAQTLNDAEEAAGRALALDPENSSAFVALGSVQRDRGEWAESEAHYLRALSMDPDLAEAYMQYAELLLIRGRVAEAVIAADRAAALDPTPVRFFVLGSALVMDDRREEAVAVFRLGAERDIEASRPGLWANVGGELLVVGMTDEARTAYERAAEAGSRLDFYGVDPPDAAPTPPAQSQITEFVEAVAVGEPARVPLGMRHALLPVHWMMLGEPDSAISVLVRVSDSGPPGNVAWELWSPVMDSLRQDERLLALIESRDLEDARLVRTLPGDRRRPTILATQP